MKELASLFIYHSICDGKINPLKITHLKFHLKPIALRYNTGVCRVSEYLWRNNVCLKWQMAKHLKLKN